MSPYQSKDDEIVVPPDLLPHQPPAEETQRHKQDGHDDGGTNDIDEPSPTLHHR